MDDDTIKKPKVLYVEDDRGLAALYSARLKAAGYDVKCCYDGDSALQTGKDFRPDLILLDLMMPTLNGYDALEMFRTLPETSGAKIIIMSALSQPEDIAKAKALGADDYMVKSQILIDDAMAMIHRLLGLSPADEPAQSAPAANGTAAKPL